MDISSIIKAPIASWYIPFFYPHEYKNTYGGRGSGKSHHAAINAISRVAHLWRDPDNLKRGLPYYPYKKTRILSGREFHTTLESSVKVVLEEKIYEMGLNDQFSIQNSQIVHRGETGSKIIFKGLGRNINNIRSAESIDVWWFEEAQFLTGELMEVIIPTARAEHFCSITNKLFVNEKWTVWNPKYRSDWVWVRFVVKRRKSDLSLHINYMHNPFLPSTSRREAYYDKLDDENQYLHIWCGMPDDSDADKQVLPYPYLQACVDAWDKRPEISAQMRTEAGFDIALGGADDCALTVRTGPVVHDIIMWNGEPDLNALARKSHRLIKKICEKEGVTISKINYDGAHPMIGAYREVGEICASESVLFNGAVLGPDAQWEKRISNKDYFSKRNIQMGTAVRQRAARTYRMMQGDETVDPWKCLFLNPKIKDLEKVMGMLTQPIQREGMSGRMEIDKRGLENDGASPDEFDSLCLAFHNDLKGGLRARG